MPKYKVIVTETFQKAVAVVAASEAEAHRRVQDAWSSTEFIVDPCRDFKGVEFYVAGEATSEEEKVERKDV